VIAQYDLPMFGSELTPFVTAGYRWQSEVVFNLLQDPDSVQGDYGIANLGGGVRTDRWKLTAFCNNVFDKAYALTMGRESNVNLPVGGNAIGWKPGRDSERYFGVRASVNF
jgi:iron complex outermembrane receptor protein